MAAHDKKESSFSLYIDLLHPQGLPEKLPVKFVKWLINYGRFIAIVVELIVMVTFIARFKLDADLANTKEKINEQIPFIQNLNQTEALIRQTQMKLSLVRNNFTTSPKWAEIITKISQQIPEGTKLTALTFDYSTPPTLNFKLTGTSSSDVSLAAMISGLKQTPAFKDITLGNISYDSGLLTFTITGATQ